MKTPIFSNAEPVVIIMGVCGCGKSTIAKALASRLKLPYLEGDDFHPPANVEKMSNSIELNDDDRWPWLDDLGTTLKSYLNTNNLDSKNIDSGKPNHTKKGVVASCSSLKRIYRERLSNAADAPILFVLLDGSRETLLSRMQSREDHYMPASLLDSQLAILEKPSSDELALTLSIENSIDDIVSEIFDSICR